MKVDYCCYNAMPSEQAEWARVAEVKAEGHLCMANCSDCRHTAYIYVDGKCLYGGSHAELIEQVKRLAK